MVAQEQPLIHKVSIALATCLIGVSSVGAQEWARDIFTSFRHEFGTPARNVKTVYAFEIENKYATGVGRELWSTKLLSGY